MPPKPPPIMGNEYPCSLAGLKESPNRRGQVLLLRRVSGTPKTPLAASQSPASARKHKRRLLTKGRVFPNLSRATGLALWIWEGVYTLKQGVATALLRAIVAAKQGVISYGSLQRGRENDARHSRVRRQTRNDPFLPTDATLARKVLCVRVCAQVQRRGGESSFSLLACVRHSPLGRTA